LPKATALLKKKEGTMTPLIDAEQSVDSKSRVRALETTQSFLVQAPAGSGKTELLTHRMVKLLAEVDEPEQVLAITFTLAATAEMRARVLKALREAPEKAFEEKNPDLAALGRAALANDAKRGWNILQQPQRLNIQTIDAVCLAIAHQTPLLSRLGGSLTPTDKPGPLYSLAARRTLARLGGDIEISNALRALLQLRAAQLSGCEHLIADMLDKRDQWGQVLPLFDPEVSWPKVFSNLELPLQQEHDRVFAKARALFEKRAVLADEIFDLLRYACGNLGSGSEFSELEDVTHTDQLVSLAHWDCFCHFLLTRDNSYRKRVTVTQGFPAGAPGKRMKDRYVRLLDTMEAESEFHAVFCEIRGLPPAQYTPEEKEMLRHIGVILRYATAELRLVFAERGVVDFVELGLAARHVLCDEEGNATEAAGEVAGQWRHILVDEFQDTSRSQYKLLTLLLEGWRSGDEGTFFLVGDPMQSIYMFRQAEVELFESTRQHGLGDSVSPLQLEPLQLHMNFRSHSGLVETLNCQFAQIFEPSSPQRDNEYRVRFVPSRAFTEGPPGNSGFYLWPSFLASTARPEEEQASLDAEADHVLKIIQGHWPTVQAKLKSGEEFRIAVLVRAKSHLERIARRLRTMGIPFRAIEIEQLGKRQEVMDLAALTRALLHPMDRIAWLSVLRAPWCGLSLSDLHVLCGEDDKQFANRPVQQLLQERLPLLSEDGQGRAMRAGAVLEQAMRGKHRQASLARWIERTWRTLGGHLCIDEAGFENIRAFITMLEELGPDATGLKERLTELCAQPDPAAQENCGVQLMTIHKAKGLGFDVVIVPGLERITQVDSQPLVQWIQQTKLVGEAELEVPEFVVAPIGRNGVAGGIYEWIRKQQSRRDDDETRRLLYVAATRARSELHLFGTATTKVAKDGVSDLTPGNKHTMLGVAWPAFKDVFWEAWAKEEAKPKPPPQQGMLPFHPLRDTIRWRRLPGDWKPKQFAITSGQVDKDVESFERPRGSLAVRALGTVVHAFLEDLSRLEGIAVSGASPVVYEEVGRWKPRAKTLLRSMGLPPTEAERGAFDTVRALQAVLNDPVGRWIVAARTDAQTEVSWSTWGGSNGDGETIRTLRSDRIFRAGELPGSTEQTHLWIVDYKTTKHGTGGMDAFFEGEKAKYRAQLEAYAEVMQKVHGPDTPIRMALYYPLLTKLVWW
jgi:ATP-dependent helicase/nuclease subunit A